MGRFRDPCRIGEAPGPRMLVTIATGPDLWTGGTFGPEAGLVGLICTAAGIVAVATWTSACGDPLRVDAALASPTLMHGPAPAGGAPTAVADGPSTEAGVVPAPADGVTPS